MEYKSKHCSDHLQILIICLYDKTKIKNTWNKDNHTMEEDLKILSVEYLSNHWSDFPQILNLILEDQTEIKTD